MQSILVFVGREGSHTDLKSVSNKQVQSFRNVDEYHIDTATADKYWNQIDYYLVHDLHNNFFQFSTIRIELMPKSHLEAAFVCNIVYRVLVYNTKKKHH